MQLTQYPRVRQGQQTRQKLLEAMTEDPTATLNELSQKLRLSSSQIRRHRKYLKILGLVPVVLFLILTTLSTYANEIAGDESVDSIEVESVEEFETDSEEEPNENPE